MELRPYQSEAIESLRTSLTKHRRSILSLATGGGKTVIAASMVKRILKTLDPAKGKVFFCVHRRELVAQATATLREVGVDVGHIAADWPTARWKKVQVCSIQTLYRRLGKVPEPYLIILDEAHHSVASTWMSIVAHWPNKFYVGLTATPERTDGEGLGSIFNDIVHGVEMKTLMRDGYLANPDVYSVPTEMNDIKRMRMGDYQKAEMEKRATNKYIARVLDSYRKFGKNQQALFFGVSVDHAKRMADIFSDAGYTTDYVDGQMNKNVRDGVFNKLRDKQTQILTSCDLISEGFDCPDVGCIIMGRPTASLVLYRQQAGRGMRPGDDKTILDLAGNVHRHGLPWDDYQWSLNGRAGRISKDSAGGNEAKVWQCPKCFIVNEADLDKCRKCGEPKPMRTRDVTEIDVELKKVAQGGPMPEAVGNVLKDFKSATRKINALHECQRAYNRLLRIHGEVPHDEFMQELHKIRIRFKYEPGWVKFASRWVKGKRMTLM